MWYIGQYGESDIKIDVQMGVLNFQTNCQKPILHMQSLQKLVGVIVLECGIMVGNNAHSRIDNWDVSAR